MIHFGALLYDRLILGAPIDPPFLVSGSRPWQQCRHWIPLSIQFNVIHMYERSSATDRKGRIPFSNGPRAGASSGFRRLGMPAFSARSAGA
jgi:hypothetical protein